MTKREAIKAMREAVKRNGDPEVAHVHADRILVARLKALGEHTLVELYEDVKKWYA